MSCGPQRGGPARDWNRLIVALVGVSLGVSIFVVELGVPQQQVGQFIFRGLAGLLMVYCLVQGRRASADCLSEEKREGTLGLLFLTDLKGHDVVLGKLSATSLGGFYGLLSVFPVLAMTLLLGGVSSGQFWRMVLVLINTCLFSLAVGVMASALSRDHRRAVAANLFLLLGLAAVPPVCAFLLAYASPSHQLPIPLLYFCPVFAFYMGFDTNYPAIRYGLSWEDFWWSLTVIHGMAWLLVGLASWVVPHTWQDRSETGSRLHWREFWQKLNFGMKAKQKEHRRRLLDVNAFYWLAGRARLKPVHVWVFLGSLALWWLIGWLTARDVWFDESIVVTTALLLNTALKLWVAIEASQRLAEDQTTGALELLLSTPLGVNEICRGQWLALRRQFLGPLLVVLVAEFALGFESWRRAWGVDHLSVWLAGIFMLVADLAALGWVAMRAALTAKNHNQATIVAVGRILVAPWVATGLIWASIHTWYLLASDRLWTPGWRLYLGLWFGSGLAADLLFGLLARRQLLRSFRRLAVQGFFSVPPRSSRWFTRGSAVKRTAKDLGPVSSSGGRPWPWKQKVAIAGLVVMLTGAGLAWVRVSLRPVYPPVGRVTLTARETPLLISSSMMATLMILPDGSLWGWDGLLGPRHSIAPERVSTDGHWVKVSLWGNRWVGLRQDGSLWEEAGRGVGPGDPLTPIGQGKQWIDVAIADASTFAIRRDHTLWIWSPPSLRPGGIARSAANQGEARASSQEGQPAQVGTNENWAQLRSTGSSIAGLQTDGTLWVWGQLKSSFGAASSQWWFTNAPLPTRVCADTNWAAVTVVFGGVGVWNRAGELWDLFLAPPSAAAPANSVGRILLSNSAPNCAAIFWDGRPDCCEIRTNGTLWKKPFQIANWAGLPDEPWRQVGKRTDWVSLFGTGGTAFGQTADGTLWTWGLDFTQKAPMEMSVRLEIARARIAGLFSPGRRIPTGAPTFRNVCVKEPRPFMRLE